MLMSHLAFFGTNFQRYHGQRQTQGLVTLLDSLAYVKCNSRIARDKKHVYGNGRAQSAPSNSVKTFTLTF